MTRIFHILTEEVITVEGGKKTFQIVLRLQEGIIQDTFEVFFENKTL